MESLHYQDFLTKMRVDNCCRCRMVLLKLRVTPCQSASVQGTEWVFADLIVQYHCSTQSWSLIQAAWCSPCLFVTEQKQHRSFHWHEKKQRTSVSHQEGNFALSQLVQPGTTKEQPALGDKVKDFGQHKHRPRDWIQAQAQICADTYTHAHTRAHTEFSRGKHVAWYLPLLQEKKHRDFFPVFCWVTRDQIEFAWLSLTSVPNPLQHSFYVSLAFFVSVCLSVCLSVSVSVSESAASAKSQWDNWKRVPWNTFEDGNGHKIVRKEVPLILCRNCCRLKVCSFVLHR